MRHKRSELKANRSKPSKGRGETRQKAANARVAESETENDQGKRRLQQKAAKARVAESKGKHVAAHWKKQRREEVTKARAESEKGAIAA